MIIKTEEKKHEIKTNNIKDLTSAGLSYQTAYRLLKNPTKTIRTKTLKKLTDHNLLKTTSTTKYYVLTKSQQQIATENGITRQAVNFKIKQKKLASLSNYLIDITKLCEQHEKKR